MSEQSLDKLIMSGRIQIFAEKNTKEYIKAMLEKFDRNFGMSFEGNIDVHFFYSKSSTISFGLDIVPSNPSSYILSVNTKEDSEKSIIFNSIDCVQIKISDIVYQIRYSYLD